MLSFRAWDFGCWVSGFRVKSPEVLGFAVTRNLQHRRRGFLCACALLDVDPADMLGGSWVVITGVISRFLCL